MSWVNYLDLPNSWIVTGCTSGVIIWDIAYIHGKHFESIITDSLNRLSVNHFLTMAKFWTEMLLQPWASAFGAWICASITKSGFKNTLEVKDVFPQVDCMFLGLLDVGLMISNQVVCIYQNWLAEIKTRTEKGSRVLLAMKQERPGGRGFLKLLKPSSSGYVRNSNSNLSRKTDLL